MATYQPRVSFEASPTAWEFFLDKSFIVGIEGPVGSGKSYSACAKIMASAINEVVREDGYRRSRWVVIRNTYPELDSTSIRTWLELFPEDKCGPMNRSHPISHRIRTPPRRGQPGLDLEVWFLALERPQDRKRLQSLEVTGAWINEASELPFEIVEMLTTRVGRFPPIYDAATGDVVGDGEGAKNIQIIMDTNSCDVDHWWHQAAVENKGLDELRYETPDGKKVEVSWKFYKQPPALLECAPLDGGGSFIVCEPGFPADELPQRQVLPAAGRFWAVNPKAENLRWLDAGYYPRTIANKSLAFIQRFCQAKYIFIAPGKPWIPEYNDGLMATTVPYVPGLPVFGGMDIGGGTLQPAATWGQLVNGQHRCLAELSMFDTGIERFCDEWLRVVAQRFPDVSVEDIKVWVDPAAETRDELYEVEVIDHLRRRGLSAHAAPSNNPDVRREALVGPMGRLIQLPSGQGQPGYLVDKSCSMLRGGLNGKWYLKRMQTAETRHKERPEKNEYSHVCDAESYRLSGGGETFNLRRGLPAGTARQPATANPWPQAQGGNRQPGAPPRMSVDFDPFET